MSNKIFKEEIKKTTNRELDVPRAILFSLDTLNSKLTLELTLECLFANMQTDASAVEGWILVIVSLLKENNVAIKNIEIKTGVSIDEINEYIHNNVNGRLHLNRLLYRISKFYEQYKGIFNIKISNIPVGTFFYFGNDKKLWYKDMSQFKLCTNAPDNKSEAQIEHSKFDEMSERDVELSFLKKPQKLFDKLKEIFGNTYNLIDRQLPVGLFDGRKSENTYIAPGRLAAIDLWALSENREKMVVCELKKKGKKYNEGVGIISELYFYVNVMYDVFINKSITQTIIKKNIRSYQELLNNKSISNVDGVFLVDKLHSQITSSVIDLLNKNSDIRYNVIVYDESYIR